MNQITTGPLDRIGYDFVPEGYLGDGEDEYRLRNTPEFASRSFRNITGREIERLVENGNLADDWNDLWVSDPFEPDLIRRCRFHGLVRIGAMERVSLEFNDMRWSAGLSDSCFLSCDIGSRVAIHEVGYLAHMVVHDNAILVDIDECHTTNHAKFGEGLVMEGEDEEIRIWLEIGNENGGRKVLPFNGMLSSDARLWSRFRDDNVLQNTLLSMTVGQRDLRRGRYGSIGPRTVVKHCRILKDVAIGSDGYIKGCNKLKNITINSSAESPTQIGEGVELVNGIVGYGCRVFYGVKAVRFVLGDHANLKYGARLINSVLGENSTISCCEVLNSLIFPGHEQHHNSSFLSASTLLGQSNMASAATVGSNHNSRANDGEILAGRGFWPGLAVSLKHDSRFASYTLIAKGAYPHEIRNPLPFALISNTEECLQVMPAFWILHNMYALARNSWKFSGRDGRQRKIQPLEFDWLAPDTVNEMFSARDLLEKWAGGIGPGTERLKREDEPEVAAAGVEASRRPVRVLKAGLGWRTYGDLIHWYGIRTLVEGADKAGLSLGEFAARYDGLRRTEWENLGGQLFTVDAVESIREEIRSGRITGWDAVHQAYADFGVLYPELKAEHSWAALVEIHGLKGSEEYATAPWNSWLDEGIRILDGLTEATRASRAKDYDNPFRNVTFDTAEERDAVRGRLEDNDFIRRTYEDADRWRILFSRARTSLADPT